MFCGWEDDRRSAVALAMPCVTDSVVYPPTDSKADVREMSTHLRSTEVWSPFTHLFLRQRCLAAVTVIILTESTFLLLRSLLLLFLLHQRSNDRLAGEIAVRARPTERDVGGMFGRPRVFQQVIAMCIEQHATVAAACVSEIPGHRRYPTYIIDNTRSERRRQVSRFIDFMFNK